MRFGVPTAQSATHEEVAMSITPSGDAIEPGDDRRLITLERLLAIPAIDVTTALDQASRLVARELGAEKVDAFLLDTTTGTLVAAGMSETPMLNQERAIGLDRLPLIHGGRLAEVFETGVPYLTGHADGDPRTLPGFTEGLGVRSMMIVPFDVNNERRGVLQAVSTRSDQFSERDLDFLQAVARWMGMVAHKAELIEEITREAAELGRRAAAEDLITILAHDLRNYLTPLKARIELLRQRASRDHRTRDLRDAIEAGAALDRLKRMISDLLDAGRLEQGLFTVFPISVDLAPLVRETASAMRTPANDIQIHIVHEIIVNADPERVRQAVENLLTNAVQHAPPDTPVIVALKTTRQEGRKWATITVSDQGPGIPADLMPQLFERFQHGPRSTGLGLGLYLAHQIALAHEGTLTAESSAATGTCFQLSLPADC